MTKPVSIGIIGTSWWADAMYMPPLHSYERVNVVAACGRNPDRLADFAERWSIPHTFTDYNALIESGLCEAIIVATGNETHYPITIKALNHALHVLCEKPLGLTYAEAAEMRDLAADRQLITLTPFTYRNMPTTRYIKHLIDSGYLGQPYHLHLRYYAGYGRDGSDYNWRFDTSKAGSGALGDIASHFIYLAEWFYGPIEAVSCHLAYLIDRPAVDPEGNAYEPGDDAALLTLRFANGAQGMIHATTLAYEENTFDQMHEMDFHGSAGTLRQVIDWNQTQRITGTQVGQGPSTQVIEVPDDFWGSARRDQVQHTYKDTFRVEGRMVRDFVDAVAEGRPAVPDFAAGARVQHILDKALESHKSGCWMTLDE